MSNGPGPVAAGEAAPSAQPMADGGRRVVTLDGLRGLMTILVIVSHYFGELPNGFRIATFAWIAVDMFFVLSGFLIGKLILEKSHHANFFAVFYLRRFCRIIPAYMLTVIVLAVLLAIIGAPWRHADIEFPLWSYLTFVQGFFMASTQSIGAHWLAPTWTLGVEEHFYLVAPALIVFTPRRWLVPVLVGAAIFAVGLRLAINYFGLWNQMVGLVLLPGRADVLVCGLLAAVAIRTDGIDWERLTPALRVTPILGLAVALGLYLLDQRLFQVLAPLAVSIGCAAFILCIVLETPEARRFRSRILRFFGNNGYCLYLVHLPILGLMHGLFLGQLPDIVTPSQWLVTLAALPVCVFVGWAMTKTIEEPLTRYGRRWHWSERLRSAPDPVGAPGLSRPA